MNTLLRLILPTAAALLLTGCAAQDNASDAVAETDSQPTQNVQSAGNSQRAETVNLKVNVPPQAEQVVSEVGGLTYKSDKTGTLYLYDSQANQLVSTFNVQRGQTLRVAGTANRITLDGNEINHDARLSPGKTYVVYLLETGRSQSSAAPSDGNRQRFSIPVELEEDDADASR